MAPAARGTDRRASIPWRRRRNGGVAFAIPAVPRPRPMRRKGHRLAVALLSAVTLTAVRAGAATLLVTTAADAGPGSLRHAIPEAGVPAIAPATDLPALTAPVVIDGTTQSPAGRVELHGTTTYGFTITG